LPIFLFICLLSLLFIYNFSYYFPFTNNAFVVSNVRPVAANVNGYITRLYVKNGEYVKSGQPMFMVFQKPYLYAYQKAKSDVEVAQAKLAVLSTQVEKTNHLLKSKQDQYEKLNYDYMHYKSALDDHAVSQIQVNTSLKERNATMNELLAFKKELELNQQQLIVQRKKIDSLIAVMKSAQINLDETVVYAKNNGIVQNLFASLGTPIKIREPIFAFVDTDNLFIQANFSEIDLRRVKPGNRVSIYPRIYMGAKKYEGVVISKNWASSRQITDPRSQQQIVTNSENNWFLLPQRFPVQIRILNYDPTHYPLNVGASAYVYVHT
jgi:multidrug resistance efflux pump